MQGWYLCVGHNVSLTHVNLSFAGGTHSCTFQDAQCHRFGMDPSSSFGPVRCKVSLRINRSTVAMQGKLAIAASRSKYTQ